MKKLQYNNQNKTAGYRTPSKLRYRVERIWLRNWLRKLILRSFILVTCLLCLIMGFIFLKNELRFQSIHHAIEHFVFDRPELSITSLDIKNANPDLSNQINAILQLSFPINPLKININYLQEIINDLESVDFSKIRITENGVLEIFINERIPAVIHRYDRQLMLLDINGRRVGEVFSRVDRQDLPLVVGLGANLKVFEALEIYKSSTAILNRMRGIILVGERRWDIVLDSGQRIKLPEKESKIALISFLRSDKSKRILGDGFSIVDLRYKGQIIVRRRLLVFNEETI